jgi:hypothetical protein
MNAKQFIEAAGGHKTVMALTGLSRSALSNWEHQNYIPPHWIKFFCLLNPVIRKATLELEPTYPTSKKRLSVVQDSSGTQQKSIDSTRKSRK